MIKIFLLTILFVLPFSFLNAQEKEIEIETFISKMNMDGYVVIDIRTKNEISNGMIENSEHINFLSDEFESRVPELDMGNTYLLYCRSGSRSKKAATKMAELGYEAYSLKGGVIHWENMGHQLIKIQTEQEIEE